MIANPEKFSRWIVSFSEKSYFHPFEIISRLAAGVGFTYFSGETRFPAMFLGIGILLVAVGAGLLLTPPSRHRQFARWSAEAFKGKFRFFGLCSLLFAGFLIFAANVHI